MTKDGPPAEQHGPPPPEAATAEHRLQGHIAHLTPEEEKSFEEFKVLASKDGLYRPATDSTRASHDDGTLVRYMRARKFVPQDAFVQFKDTEIWRKQNDLDALYEKIDIHDYQEARSVYPQWTGRRDKRGIPVYLYEVGKLDSKKMIAYSSATSKSKVKGHQAPSRMLRLFALYENLTRFVMPLCSAVPGRPNPETPVDQSNNIVDISKVGLKQFWNLKSHMQDASTLATAHYPETLDRIFIIGAPSFFPTVWGWIKRWFDPITTSKIFILSSNQVLPTLSTFMDIEDIPKKYGGQLDFECGMMPVLDPQIQQCIDIKGGAKGQDFFLAAPVRWIEAGEDGEMTALGVGTIDGRQRQEPVAVLHSMAVRVASHSKNFQSQRTQNVVPNSRPETPRSQAPSHSSRPVSAAPSTSKTAGPSPLVGMQFATKPSTQAPVQPSTEPSTLAAPFANLSTEYQHEQPQYVDKAPEHSMQNGGPPEKIQMPLPPTQIQRMETEYVTPPSDPSEIKQLQ
ncbi:hypothetical protein P7C71_g4147, partial [Lecanoromycetidae sp. Uapishka_2]